MCSLRRKQLFLFHLWNFSVPPSGCFVNFFIKILDVHHNFHRILIYLTNLKPQVTIIFASQKMGNIIVYGTGIKKKKHTYIYMLTQSCQFLVKLFMNIYMRFVKTGIEYSSNNVLFVCVSGSSSLSYNTTSHTDQSPRLAAKEGKNTS